MSIARHSLLSLENYSKSRIAMRNQVIEHKKERTVPLGNHVTFLFEDELTIRYQIQEMLHIEKIFEEDDIQAELDAYLPLVPDGSNLKATMQIEYTNEIERHAALARLIGIEDRVFIQVEGEPPVYAIADEDLERENDEKTSAVHFVRFELTPAMNARLRDGAALQIGCDHPNYLVPVQTIESRQRASLLKDLT
jgi:precorrin-3B methylase